MTKIPGIYRAAQIVLICLFALTAYAQVCSQWNEAVHIGDSFAADVEGAIGAGLRAIWYRPRGTRVIEDVLVANDALSTRAALVQLGVIG